MNISKLPIFYFLLFILIVRSDLTAQTVDESPSDSVQNKNAFEFILLNEQSFWFRSSLSESFYWKVGLDLSAMISDEDNNNYWSPYETKHLSVGFKLSTQCYTSIYSNDILSFDVGLGPSLNYLKSISETSNNNSDEKFKSEETDFEYGILATMSAQFQLSEKIFLLAKYDYGIMKGFETRRHTRTDDEPTSYERDYWQLQLSTIKLGVGIFL